MSTCTWTQKYYVFIIQNFGINYNTNALVRWLAYSNANYLMLTSATSCCTCVKFFSLLLHRSNQVCHRVKPQTDAAGFVPSPEVSDRSPIIDSCVRQLVVDNGSQNTPSNMSCDVLRSLARLACLVLPSQPARAYYLSSEDYDLRLCPNMIVRAIALVLVICKIPL